MQRCEMRPAEASGAGAGRPGRVEGDLWGVRAAGGVPGSSSLPHICFWVPEEGCRHPEAAVSWSGARVGTQGWTWLLSPEWLAPCVETNAKWVGVAPKGRMMWMGFDWMLVY